MQKFLLINLMPCYVWERVYLNCYRKTLHFCFRMEFFLTCNEIEQKPNASQKKNAMGGAGYSNGILRWIVGGSWHLAETLTEDIYAFSMGVFRLEKVPGKSRRNPFNFVIDFDLIRWWGKCKSWHYLDLHICRLRRICPSPLKRSFNHSVRAWWKRRTVACRVKLHCSWIRKKHTSG